MKIKRRDFLAGSTAAVGAMMVSGGSFKARAKDTKVLKFVPQADLAVLDPHGTPAYVTRNHAMLVYDTLYGVDSNNVPRPQMVKSGEPSADGKTWTLVLRDGLKFHDGSPVRGVDVVASLKRWMVKDGFAAALAAVLTDLSAPDDKTIVFKLSKPFPILPDLLGKMASFSTGIMPERLAKTDPNTPVPEIIGSGPYRYVMEKRIPGSLNVYERFEDYVPRSEPADNLAGGKIAHFDRIEWHTIPDPATAAAALMSGEIDWWEAPTPDLLPIFKGKDVKVGVKDSSGNIGLLRMNFLQPPFNNRAVREVVLKAVEQTNYMLAAVGEDKSRWSVPQGFFHPKSTLASDFGLSTFVEKKNYEALKQELKAAGYKGEKIVLMSTADFPVIGAFGEVAADMQRKIGMNVDHQVQDWATVSARMKNKGDISAGGYHIFANFVAGAGTFNTAAHTYLRAGASAFDGWPNIPAIEELRAAWLEATTVEEQREIGRKLQEICLKEVPFIPLGLFYFPTAYRSNLEGILDTFPVFWNVRRV
ncbi:ABC transporter substrate-binding protein [uncultured Ferrovibrio sp.]|jgi:ABC-type dipeptide transport system, periplasmic component|uniref:ABC transporter substrate-binding protein n=1 Tax=uncultured Ferrovibrio sp. TaxID=1576913 RepID=UPI00261561C6|nr:ABC transporter substrate-binding protein [uncultured Ferrovibrio sp.]